MERLNKYRVMWIFVFFDIPTETKKERKASSDFRKNLIKDGFQMLQYSAYIRPCGSSENADVHQKRVKQFLPEYGQVTILRITDKQFGDMENYINVKPEKPKTGPVQLEIEFF